MEAQPGRMAIACHPCAKAKAKCDKQVPCSRCATKNITCVERATRRSSHNQNRRNGAPRPHPERALTSSNGVYHLNSFNNYGAPTETQFMSPTHVGPHHIPPVPPIPQAYAARHMSMPDIHQHGAMNIAPVPYNAPEMEHQMIQNGFTQTPPDMPMPMTPMMANVPQIDGFMHMNPDGYDQHPDSQYLQMTQGNYMDFDPTNPFTGFNSPGFFPDQNDQLIGGPVKFMPTPNQIHIPLHNGSATVRSGVENGASPQFPDLRMPRTRPLPPAPPPGLSPSTASSSGLQEPDAVIAAHQSWPFFQCNAVERGAVQPPKTARIYLEGLLNTLRNQSTWQTWTTQMDETVMKLSPAPQGPTDQAEDIAVKYPKRPDILIDPMEFDAREKLLAITQVFLHKALDTHKNDRTSRDETPASPHSSRDEFLPLPRPEVMQHFLQSYAVRHEPYYSLVPARRLDLDALMNCPNSRAASLLILMMVASGAAATSTVEARYIASGLTEACRISLFDSIEKDVMMSRDPIALRAALLFICQAVWSGDKWHMDIAMGQRGTYLSMLAHTGLFEKSDFQFNIDDFTPSAYTESLWNEWKEQESLRRLAHAWITVDQEISLFSDTYPLLSIDTLHTPMPGSNFLWQAQSLPEWLEVLNVQTDGNSYTSPVSLRDFYSNFANGAFADKTPPSFELRLLLHPLQAQICYLRQFIPSRQDAGQASLERSRAANKARFSEVTSLLDQWYGIAKKSAFAHPNEVLTTAANLILYHLISLNTITSFRDIEQFARKAADLGPFRPAGWLQMRCVDAPREVYFHVGQILKCIRSMPQALRPPWWAGVMYRTALTAWAASICQRDEQTTVNGGNASPMHLDDEFTVDTVLAGDEAMTRYIKSGKGTPMLTRRDNVKVPMDEPNNILQHCIEVLEDDSSMRLADGIKRKLKVFQDAWKDI